MCAHMIWGQAYSGYFGMPLLSLDILLSIALLTIVIWPVVYWLRSKTTLGMVHEPQPHDERALVPYMSALEALRERYARDEIEP